MPGAVHLPPSQPVKGTDHGRLLGPEESLAILRVQGLVEQFGFFQDRRRFQTENPLGPLADMRAYKPVRVEKWVDRKEKA